MSTDIVCPKCARSADARAGRCASCGLDFLEWFERRAWGPDSKHLRAEKAAAPRTKTRSRPAASWLLAGALAAGAGAAACLRGLWLVAGPGAGARLPAQAFVDQRHGFAFTPPSGWQLGLVERADGGMTQVARLSRQSETIDVLVGPADVSEELGQERGYALMQRAFNGADLQVRSAQAFSLDGVAGQRLEASVARAYLPSPNAGRQLTALGAPAPQYESAEGRALLIVAPLSGRSLLVKVFAEKEQFEREKPVLDSFLASFRVIRRPFAPF